MKERSIEEIREFCKGHYYSDIEEGILWEPFEDYEEEHIKGLIESDIKSLCEFIGVEE